MARNPMQDIVPKDGRSIRNVPVPDHRSQRASAPKPDEVRVKINKKEPVREPVREIREPRPERSDRLERLERLERMERRPAPPVVEEEIVPEPHPERDTFESVRKEFASEALMEDKKTAKKGAWKKFAIIGSIVAVVGLAVAVSSIFSGATLTLTPRTAVVAVNGEYTAKKVAAETELGYQIVTLKQTGEQTVKANGEKQVDKKASGTIIIFNNYSTTPQRLVKNTRFATPEGLIFRITDSVSVPGKTGTSPGSVEATVMADEPGEKYNVGLKDFTIPGFKGDPRYSAFYARSKTPLSGGFSGIQKIVDDEDRAKAKSEIEGKITSELLKQAEGQIPADRVTYEKAYKIEFAPLPEVPVGSSEVTLKEEGTLHIVTFDREDLSMVVAKNHINDFNNEPVIMTDIDKLSFEPKGDFNPAVANSISFALSGPGNFEWLFNELAIKQALTGQSRTAIPALLQEFPMVEKADITLRPFWARKFPSSYEKITIKKAQ